MAAEKAEAILTCFGLDFAPVDPIMVAEKELPRLRCYGDNFRNRFDGQLEYHRQKDTFLLLFNNKYDAERPGTEHHPRTRYSIAHELGHFYLDHHRAHLMRGGEPHGSRTEFLVDALIEREADAFAAGLLMPQRLIRPMINEENLTVSSIEKFASTFRTSLVSTAIRSVRLSDFPCALAGIRDGLVSWMFVSAAIIEGGCYPGARGAILSSTAKDQWAMFVEQTHEKATAYAYVRDWFRTYDRDSLGRLTVTEHYLPVPVMDTLLVLLTVSEEELFPDID